MIKKMIVTGLLITALFIGCSEPPDKIATIRVVTVEGHVDTIRLEYYQRLSVTTDGYICDGNGNIKGTGIRRYSIIGDIEQTGKK